MKILILFISTLLLSLSQITAQIMGGLEFNGIDNYVEVAESPLNTIGTGDFTFEAWIKGDATTQNTHPTIFSNRGNSPFGGGVVFFFHNQWGGSASKMLAFQINAQNYVIINNGSFNGSLLDNTCHHVAITRQGNNLSFYADGVLFGTRVSVGSKSLNFDGPVRIGKDKAINNTFNGTISQVRIWDVARTEAEIFAAKDISLQGTEAGLLAYWEMNDENGQIAIDKTNQFDGQLGSGSMADSQDPTWTEGCIEGYYEPFLHCRQPISTNATLGTCVREDLIMLEPFIIDPSNVGGGIITNDRPVDFNIGTTVVTWTLTNDDGSVSTCVQEVTITDTEMPVVSSCNTMQAYVADNSCFASVYINPTATDNCGIADISGVGTYNFEPGFYTHSISITDVNGNETVHNIAITVHETTAPTFHNCPEAELVLSSTDGENVDYPTSMMPFATDNCGAASLTNDLAAAGLPIGSSLVTFVAIDTYGNSSACMVDVLVEQDVILLHPVNPIEASLEEEEDSQIVSWNPLDAATQCEYCTETNLEGFTFVGTYWGHQYFLADEVSLTRQDAQLLAEVYDAHLAVISSAGENTFLKEALSNEVRTAWIGLVPQLENEEWTFVWDNEETNVYNALVLDANEINEDTRIVLSQEGNWIAATNAEEKYFLIERPCVSFTQMGPLAPDSTTELLRSGDSWPEGAYEVNYAVIDMCGNETELNFDLNVQTEISDFCTTTGMDNSLWIEGVTFHEMTNVSGSDAGYADYSEQNISMNIGDGIVLLDLTAGGNTSNEVLYWRVWLDKNNDGDFFDANEVIFEQSTENSHIQANLALEDVEASRLRVAVARHSFPAPCGNPYVGEVEDYSLTLYTPEQIDANTEREAQIGISPNPANTHVNVDLADFAGEEVTIRIFDIFGKLKTTTKRAAAFNNAQRIELGQLTTGLYYLSVTAGERTVTKPLIISNGSASAVSSR